MTKVVDGVQEIVETSSRAGANSYLDHGYRLLSVEQTAYWQTVATAKGETGYVQKRIVYVLGRPVGVSQWQLPAREKPSPVEVGA